MTDTRLSKGAFNWLRDNEQVIRALFSGFRIPVDDDNINAWFVALGDLSQEDLAVAVTRALRECKSFVTPPQVRAFVVSTSSLTDEQRAEWAWNMVRDAMRKVGSYATVDFSDRLANAAIRMLGSWPELCDTEPDKMAWKGKEFQRQYVMLARNGQGDGSPLPGLVDTENASKGLSISKAVPFDCRLVAHPIARMLEYTGHHDVKKLGYDASKKAVRRIGLTRPIEAEDVAETSPSPAVDMADQKERLRLYGEKLARDQQYRDEVAALDQKLAEHGGKMRGETNNRGN